MEVASFLMSIVSVSVVTVMVHSMQTSEIPECRHEEEYCITSCEDRNVTVNRDVDNNLCASTLNHRIVNTANGLVAFSVLIPYEILNEKHDIEFRLMAVKNGTESSNRLCSYGKEGIELHSTFTIFDGHKNSSISCSLNQLAKVEWQFNYLFTGCYLVEIFLNSDCISAPFMIESDFKKELLADKKIEMQPRILGNTIHILAHHNDLLVNDCNNPMGLFPCVELHVSKDSEKLWMYRVYSEETGALVTPNANSAVKKLRILNVIPAPQMRLYSYLECCNTLLACQHVFTRGYCELQHSRVNTCQ